MNSRPERRPVVIDLFSGAGGLSLGLERAGFDVAVAVEQEAIHAATYAYNFPNTVVLNADVATLKPELLRKAIVEGLRRHGRSPSQWDGEIDALAGGPPCQGFSVIGKREASEKRNKLVYAFCKLVETLRPRYFLMENVPGMAVGEQERILRRLIKRFRAAGYELVNNGPQLVNAADFGVPQDRSRLFFVGARADVYTPGPVVREVPRFGFTAGVTVEEAIGDLPDADAYDSLRTQDGVELSDAELITQLQSASKYARLQLGVDVANDDLSYPRSFERNRLTCSLRTDHSKDVKKRFAATPRDGFEPISRYHRLSLDGRANTIRAGTGPDHGSHTSARPIHPTKPRVITAREAARLQSFPDWFLFHRTRWHAFRQIGNAVPPLLAHAVSKTIIDALDRKLKRPTTELSLKNDEFLDYSPSEAVAHFSRAAVAQPKRTGRAPQSEARGKQKRAAKSKSA